MRLSLVESTKQLPIEIGPRIVQHTTKSNKVIDTEKKHERKELKADGGIVTETKTSITHEEVIQFYLLFSATSGYRIFVIFLFV